MRYIENPSANLVSHCSGTQDGHGGHAQEHYEEMRQIAQEEIAKVIPEIYREAYENVEPGSFSDRVFALDNKRIYRHR